MMGTEFGRSGADAPSGHSRAEPEEVSALRASVPNAAGLYIYTVLVSRRDPGRVVSSAVQGYRFANNEDEARGMAVAYAVAAKPDFGMDQVLTLRVDDDHVLNVASAIEARRAETAQTGSVHESAVANGETPTPSSAQPGDA